MTRFFFALSSSMVRLLVMTKVRRPGIFFVIQGANSSLKHIEHNKRLRRPNSVITKLQKKYGRVAGES